MAGTILLPHGILPLNAQSLSIRTGGAFGAFRGQDGVAWIGELAVGIAPAAQVHVDLGLQLNSFPMLAVYGEVQAGDRDPFAIAVRGGAGDSLGEGTIMVGGRAYLNTEVRPFHVWAGIDWLSNDFFDEQSPMVSLGLGLRWPD